MKTPELQINSNRFLANLAELKQIGATPEGGINRPALGKAHLQARAWFQQKITEAGLDFQVDSAGNHSARMNCASTAAPTLLIGSHLDSVYNGGAYDGALGVLAGLEVLQTIQNAGLKLPFKLEVIDFTDEEGTLLGMLGSKALCGDFDVKMLSQGVASQEAIQEALTKAEIEPDQIAHARREPTSLYGYLELHIEQGPKLEQASLQVGVVSAIVGLRVIRVTFKGRANHAGTTAMDQRRDAGLGASALHLAVQELVKESYQDCVATVGQMTFKPGGVNIVPAEAVMSVDFRSVNEVKLEQLEREIIKLVQSLAHRYGLESSIQPAIRHEPARMDNRFQNAIERAAETLKLRSIRMPSGAGHDAQNMASICPSGMIFVPSRDGVSHSPYEYTSDAACVHGANTLLHSVLNLAGIGSGNP
jgi:hydantoinase/carbamoylase family amidase